MRRLVWCSPLPPTRSGVADYADELLPHVASHCAVTVVRPPGWDASPPWGKLVSWCDADTPPAATQLLHLGNNPYHLWVAQRLRAYGGVVVLHDTVLHHLLVEEAAATGDWGRFAEELELAAGPAGRALAQARRWGYFGPLDPFLFPARKAYLRYAQGVIVHNRTAAQAVKQEMPGLAVLQVPLGVASLAGGDGRRFRNEHQIGEQELLAVHLGFLTPAKGLETLLRAMAALKELQWPVRLLVVGEGVEGAKLSHRVRELGMDDRVQLLGYVTAQQLADVLAAADVGLVPRFPTAGETSAAVLRFLACGRPVIVCGYQQFLEFPAEVACRIPPGLAGIPDLVRWLVHFACNPGALAERKAMAKRFWQEGGYEPAQAAHALLAAVAELTEDKAGRGAKGLGGGRVV
ncbi:MAG: glycosyltransferase [Thermoanaerobaculum sp.]|nr:glycosyltransferase [Thermoanaerobaculum sp.]MDW7966631.1 glycosyltransferase [Thermoanaerobaculum sp.]